VASKTVSVALNAKETIPKLASSWNTKSSSMKYTRDKESKNNNSADMRNESKIPSIA
jgi:hypothetical protein